MPRQLNNKEHKKHLADLAVYKQSSKWKAIKAEELRLRLTLFEWGLNDRQISRALGRAPRTIAYWRKKNNLPSNPRQTNTIKHTYEVLAQRIHRVLDTYYNKSDILRELGDVHDIIDMVMRKHNIALNPTELGGRYTPSSTDNWEAIRTEELRKRLTLYIQGCNDKQIGEAVGKYGSAIAYWRNKNNLPANGKRGRKSRKLTTVRKSSANLNIG